MWDSVELIPLPLDFLKPDLPHTNLLKLDPNLGIFLPELYDNPINFLQLTDFPSQHFINPLILLNQSLESGLILIQLTRRRLKLANSPLESIVFLIEPVGLGCCVL